MKFLSEFKAFALRGNVLDMAVGVIIGGAFAKLSGSFVNDIMMPPIGMLAGKVNFADLFVSLDMNHYENIAAATAAKAPIIKYGIFINTCIDFLLMAFAVFLLVKLVSKLQKAPAPAPPATTPTEKLLTEIRDALLAQKAR